MSSSKKTILFTACASVVLLVLTYLITVNTEAGFITINSIWLSNTFFLAFFGGMFASMVVVLLCEIQRFCALKRSMENYMFLHARNLYRFLFQLQQNINDFQTHPNQEIPQSFEDNLLAQAQNEVNALLGVDYMRLSAKNSLLVGHQKILSGLEQRMLPVNQGKSAFWISYILTKMDRIKNSDGSILTCEDTQIKSALSAQQKHITNVLEFVEEYLELIDGECKDRFSWKLNKASIESSYVSIFEAWSLDEYLKA